MTSFRQIEANRHNALKSTGPRTKAGKRHSRRNALRHGLTAETVIGNLEDPKEYKAFELAVVSDFDAQTAIERELALRLASLLWRLRRATAIESGLFATQLDGGSNDNAAAARSHNEARSPTGIFVLVPAEPPEATLTGRERTNLGVDAGNCNGSHSNEPGATKVLITRCFQGLADIDRGTFERLNRYEAALWRQACQVLVTLDALQHRSLYGIRSRQSARHNLFPPKKRGPWSFLR